MILKFKDNFHAQHQESSHCSYRDVSCTIGDAYNNFYQRYVDIQVEEDVSSVLNDIIQSVSNFPKYDSQREFINDRTPLQSIN